MVIRVRIPLAVGRVVEFRSPAKMTAAGYRRLKRAATWRCDPKREQAPSVDGGVADEHWLGEHFYSSRTRKSYSRLNFPTDRSDRVMSRPIANPHDGGNDGGR